MSSDGNRILGFDFARALAVLGMVIVNFKVVMSAEHAGPAWLVWLAGLLDGRAAATFVILAGVGVSLLSQRGRLAGDRRRLGTDRLKLIKRSAFLFVVGLLYSPIWPADILHFYALYLLIGAALLSATGRQLWGSAAVLVAVFLVLLFVFDYERGWKWETLDYVDFWTPAGMIRHLFFNGFHPVFPWAAFLVAGMWLGRQDLRGTQRRQRILWVSAVVVVVAECASALLLWTVSDLAGTDGEDMRSLLGTAPMPPMPLYLFSAGGVAFGLIMLCIMITEGYRGSRWVGWLVATGQLALTLYVAHVVIGMGLLETLGRLEKQTLGFAVVAALVFYVIGTAFSVLWTRRFQRGPLEWLMRRLT